MNNVRLSTLNLNPPQHFNDCALLLSRTVPDGETASAGERDSLRSGPHKALYSATLSHPSPLIRLLPLQSRSLLPPLSLPLRPLSQALVGRTSFIPSPFGCREKKRKENSELSAPKSFHLQINQGN